MKSNLWAMYEHLSPGKVQAGEGAGYSDKLYSDYYWAQALWEFYNPKQAGAFSGFKNEHIPKPRTAEEKFHLLACQALCAGGKGRYVFI